MSKKERGISKIFQILFLKVGIIFFSLFLFLIITIELVENYEDKQNQKELVLQTQKSTVKADVESVMFYLDILNDKSIERLDSELKTSMTNAMKIVSELYNELKKRGYSDDLIQKNIKEVIRPLRYLNNRAYIYILSSDKQYVMHPIHPEIEKVTDITTINGVDINKVAELITRTKKSGDNFFTYNWTLDNLPGEKETTKRVYSKVFEPYNWIFVIGDLTSSYTNSIREEAIGWIVKSFENSKEMLFVNKLDGEAIVVKSSVIKRGDNIKDFADPNGLKIFSEEHKIATQKDGGFLFYSWKEPNGKWTPKLAYIKGYPKWDWMIGASISREASIKELDSLGKTSFETTSYKFSVIIIFIGLIFLLFTTYVRKVNDRINLNFNRFSELLKASFSNNKTIETEVFDLNEITDISHSINKILISYIESNNLLNESERRLFVIIDNAPILIQGYDRDLNVVFWNKKSEKSTQLKKEEVIGKKAPVNSLYGEYMAKIILDNLFTANSDFTLFEIEFKDKSIKHQYWASFMASDDLVIWIGHDVTDIKEREIKAKEDVNFINTILESIPIPVFYKDTNSVYIGANNEFLKINGFKENSIKGLSVFDVAPLELAKVYKAKDDEFFKNRKVQVYDNKFFNKRESVEKTFTYHKAPFYNSKGELLGLIGAMTDITEKVEFEDKITNYQKELNISNKTKDRFFKIIAHDLKNPFQTFIKFADLLIKSIADRNVNKSITYAEIMKSSSYSGFQLLSNLLEWSRSQSGSIKLDLKKLNLQKLTIEILPMFKNDILEKALIINNNIQSNASILADSHLISVVLSNLISNAIKYSNIGGVIDLDFESNNLISSISVTDYGVGIAENNIAKLFKIDQSYSTIGTNGEKGTGLGLILCKEFVTRHNGEILCESKVNYGTKFTLTFLNKSNE